MLAGRFWFIVSWVYLVALPLFVHIVSLPIHPSIPFSHSFFTPVMKTRKLPVAKALGYLRDSEPVVTPIRSRPHAKPAFTYRAAADPPKLRLLETAAHVRCV